MVIVILSMKLHSYVMTNRMLKKWGVKYANKIAEEKSKGRAALEHEDSSRADYLSSDDEWMHDKERATIFPKNITIGNFWLFLWVPSLVYEPEFLRRPNKRLDVKLLKFFGF